MARMTLKGDYSDLTSYSVGDVVVWTDGMSYMLRNPAKAGTPPTETACWERVKQILSEAIDLIMDAISIAESGALTGKVANNLTTTASGKVLDARQGKALKTLIDDCLTADDIEDDLVGTASNKALSANQGTALKKMVTDVNPDSKTLVLLSSTESSTKKFAITVDDSGELTATEVTAGA